LKGSIMAGHKNFSVLADRMTAESQERAQFDHAAAVAEVRRLWGAEKGTPEGDRLDQLLVLVSDYEDEHDAIAPPDSLESRQRAQDLEDIRDHQEAMKRIASGEERGLTEAELDAYLAEPDAEAAERLLADLTKPTRPAR
jgi:antitoxin component HigA of HigAB toxin-antitoxin module